MRGLHTCGDGGGGDIGGRDWGDVEGEGVAPATVVGAVVGALNLCRGLCGGKTGS